MSGEQFGGQWLGRYSGINEGTLILDLDVFEGLCQGWAFLYSDDESIPGSCSYIVIPDDKPNFTAEIEVKIVDPSSLNIISAKEAREKFPQYTFSDRVNISAELINNELNASWTAGEGRGGSCKISKSRAGEKSSLIPLKMDTWADFKRYVEKLSYRKYIFRGQPSSRRLRTSFHRTGRANLLRFLHIDINVLQKHLASVTAHTFDLSRPMDTGAFYTLVQHHGYPTPLLDWTYSPYVAAFFAYRKVSKEYPEETVRIFVFDAAKWKRDWKQLDNRLVPMRPHVSVVEMPAIDNKRMVPQQAISLVTNIDDIETYIETKRASVNSSPYLLAIDLPASEYIFVKRDLATMGITAGSLFPGVDGACEELMERNFVYG